MFRNRTWGILGILVLVQAGIIICYYGTLSGCAAPPEAAKSGDKVKEKEPSRPPKATKKQEGEKTSAPTPPSKPEETTSLPSRLATGEPSGKGKEPSAPPDPPLPPVVGTVEKGPSPPPVLSDPGVPASPATKKQEGSPPAPLTGELIPVKSEVKDAKETLMTPPPAVGGANPMPVTPVNPTDAKAVNVAQPLIPTAAPKPAAMTACPWNLRVAVVGGKTLLTAQTGQEIRFRVVCDQLNLQAPCGIIAASGSVKLSSSGLEGTCDNLAISWQADQVVLDGKAQLKCHREGQDLELKGDKLSLRLTSSGVKKSPSPSRTRWYPKRQDPDPEDDEDVIDE
jgi:hypothetical protein